MAATYGTVRSVLRWVLPWMSAAPSPYGFAPDSIAPERTMVLQERAIYTVPTTREYKSVLKTREVIVDTREQ